MIYRETQLNLCSNSSTHAKDLLDFLLKANNKKHPPHNRPLWGNVGVCGLLDKFRYSLAISLAISSQSSPSNILI